MNLNVELVLSGIQIYKDVIILGLYHEKTARKAQGQPLLVVAMIMDNGQVEQAALDNLETLLVKQGNQVSRDNLFLPILREHLALLTLLAI